MMFLMQLQAGGLENIETQSASRISLHVSPFSFESNAIFTYNSTIKASYFTNKNDIFESWVRISVSRLEGYRRWYYPCEFIAMGHLSQFLMFNRVITTFVLFIDSKNSNYRTYQLRFLFIDSKNSKNPLFFRVKEMKIISSSALLCSKIR